MASAIIGLCACNFKSAIISSKLGHGALADIIPVMSAGIPADRLVVDDCELMASFVPYFGQ